MSGWSRFGDVLDSCAVYLTLQFERCAIFSLILIGVVLLLRKLFFSGRVFAKGILWSLFLIIPFLGKLKVFYESSVVVMATWWLTGITMHNLWISRIYMAGILTVAVCVFGKRLYLRRVVSGMERSLVAGKEVRVTVMNITPFTIGLIKPKIVLPRIMVEQYREDELAAIVQHELTHSRLGHLWYYLAWDLLRCLLWVNPFLSICQKYLRADIEDICDRVCIQNSGRPAHEYGEMLLKSMKLLRSQQENVASVATYAGEKEFNEIKRRIGNIASFRPYRKIACIGMIAAAVIISAALFLGIHSISYARYSEMDNMLVYEFKEGKGALLSADSTYLRQMIHYDDNYVYVDRAAFEEFLREKGTDGETFIVFGGFQKFPGMGGGGYSCLYDYKPDTKAGTVLIPYEKPEEDWMTILIKQL